MNPLTIDLDHAHPIGEVDGMRCYRIPVVITIRDGVVLDIVSEPDWIRSVTRHALLLQREVAELREQLGKKNNGRALTPEAPRRRRSAKAARATLTVAPEQPVTCQACGRTFVSVADHNRHLCRPAAAPSEQPYVKPVIIPDDPIEREAELQRLTAGRYPRPCPECWRAGVLTMLRGKIAMTEHRHSAHQVAETVAFVPLPMPDIHGWQCQQCRSGVYAESTRRPGYCVRCAKQAEATHAQ